MTYKTLVHYVTPTGEAISETISVMEDAKPAQTSHPVHRFISREEYEKRISKPVMYDRVTVAAVLNKILDDRDISVAEFAEMRTKSKQSVYRILSDKYGPVKVSWKTIDSLAEPLGMTTDEFITALESKA